jgi:hypothetical protein
LFYTSEYVQMILFSWTINCIVETVTRVISKSGYNIAIPFISVHVRIFHLGCRAQNRIWWWRKGAYNVAGSWRIFEDYIWGLLNLLSV